MYAGPGKEAAQPGRRRWQLRERPTVPLCACDALAERKRTKNGKLKQLRNEKERRTVNGELLNLWNEEERRTLSVLFLTEALPVLRSFALQS